MQGISRLRRSTGMVFQRFALFQLREQQRAMLIVTHEIAFAADVADRVVFMEGGRILGDRPAAAFFGHPRNDRIASFLARHRSLPHGREGHADD